MESPKLMEIFMEYVRTSKDERDKIFKFVQYPDGEIDIVDTRKFEMPLLKSPDPIKV